MSSTACLCNREAVLTIAAPEEIRVEKVRRIRRQLAQGRYPLGKKLDVAADRLIEELLR